MEAGAACDIDQLASLAVLLDLGGCQRRLQPAAPTPGAEPLARLGGDPYGATG